MVFHQEETRYLPGEPPYMMTHGICLPTVLANGTEQVRARFGPPGVRGEHIWCQLFSEPGSGSDLAGARTRAVKRGDGWVIDGQKVWTSSAHFSDYGLLLARTDPEAPKHRGLTMFWLDMTAPGVEVRRIHQANGKSEFNEVFFTGVVLDDSQRVGDVGDGWRTSLITLMNERVAVAGAFAGVSYDEVIALARALPGLGGAALQESGLREKVADWYVQAEGLRHLRYRAQTALSRGETPGPENSIGKVVWAPLAQELANTALELQDQFGIITDPEIAPMAAAFQKALLWAPGLRIAGGTDEILKNIIAERVLGMPGDIRVDKDVAFRDIPH